MKPQTATISQILNESVNFCEGGYAVEDTKNIKDNIATGGGGEVVDSSSAVDNNSPNPAANGNTNRDVKQTFTMDKDARAGQIFDFSNEISNKVLKKIESKNYLYDNLLRKQKENVSYETLQNKGNENAKSVFNDKFFMFGIFFIVCYALWRFLKPKNAVKKAENPLDDFTSGDTSGDTFSSLASDFLLKTKQNGD